MPLSFKQKQEIVKELKENLDKAKAVFFFSFTKLNVKQLTELREEIKKRAAKLQVVKKTLLALALKEKNFNLRNNLEGQIAIIFDFKEDVNAVKPLYKFSLKEKNIKILEGFFNKEYLSKEEVINLAKLPSRKELIAKLVYCLNYSISSFVFALKDNLTKLPRVLSQIKKNL